MRNSAPRRTNSVYGRPPNATVTASAAAAAASAKTAGTGDVTLQSIAAQMNQFAEGLAITQRSCDETKSLVSEKLGEQSKQIADNRAVASAESKALSVSLQHQFRQTASSFVWKSRGNEAQHTHSCSVLNNWIETGTALETEDIQLAKDFVRAGINSAILRNKCCKIADKSPAGWATVEEYLSEGVAADDDDDKKIRRSETTALDKKKRRLEGGSGKRGRGGGNKASGRAKAAETVTTATVASVSAPAAPLPALDPFTLAILNQSLQSFMPALSAIVAKPAKKLGPCYYCQGDHLQNVCPYRNQSAAVQQQVLAAALAPGNTKN
jgi:hypothetical protein